MLNEADCSNEQAYLHKALPEKSRLAQSLQLLVKIVCYTKATAVIILGCARAFFLARVGLFDA